MNKSRDRSVAIIFGYVNIIVHNLVSFVLTPLMIFIWGDSIYGVYKIILSLMVYFMLIDSGIKNSTNRYVAKYISNNDIDSERRYVAVIITFYVIASSILALLMIAFVQIIPTLYAQSLTNVEIELMIKSIPLLLVYTVGTLFFNCFSAILRGHKKQALVQLINILRSVVRFILLYIMIKHNYGVLEVICVDSIISIIFAVLLIGIALIHHGLIPKFEGISKAFLSDIFSFTGVMFVYTIANSLMWSVGSFIVGIKTSAIYAAIYMTAITLTNMFQSLTSTISQAFVPDIMNKGFVYSNQQELDDMMIDIGNVKLYFTMLVLIGFCAFGKEFVVLWIGDNYVDSYYVALIIMIPLSLGLIQDVPMNIMLVKNKHKTLALITIVAVIINIMISIVTISEQGIYGVAFGTAISYTIVNIIGAGIYFSKGLKFNMWRLYKETLIKKSIAFIILAVVACLISSISIGDWSGLIFKIIMFTSVYCVALAFIMGKSDRNKIMSRFSK